MGSMDLKEIRCFVAAYEEGASAKLRSASVAPKQGSAAIYPYVDVRLAEASRSTLPTG